MYEAVSTVINAVLNLFGSEFMKQESQVSVVWNFSVCACFCV